MTAPLLTQRQVAEVLGLSYSRVRELTEGAELPVVRIGRSVRVRPADLDAFVAARVTPARRLRSQGSVTSFPGRVTGGDQ